jgi:predicted GIY-YIG superfamily endonuclease
MPTDFARIKDPARREHYVYRLLTKRGRTLYIGCTMNLPRRLRDHRNHGTYGDLWVRAKAYGPYPYHVARAMERRLIEAEQLAYNREWTPRFRRGFALSKQPA